MNQTILKKAYSRQIEAEREKFLNHDFSGGSKFLYSAIKKMGVERYVFNPITIEHDMEEHFQIIDLIGTFTPREFMTIFPIRKEYNGCQIGFKDYFTTMESIKNVGLDNPIGNGFEFLWDYYNDDISDFFVNMMMTMNAVRKLQGNGDIFESFIKSRGGKMHG